MTVDVKITKQEIIDEFNARVSALIEAQIVWSDASNPGVGFPTGNTEANAVVTKPVAASLADAPPIGINEIATLFQSFAKVYTKVHLVRFSRTGNLAPFDQTQITHLTDAFQLPAFFADIDNTQTQQSFNPDILIRVSSLASYCDALYNKWNTQHKNAQEFFSFYYCHSSCHSSCHSAGRGRR